MDSVEADGDVVTFRVRAKADDYEPVPRDVFERLWQTARSHLTVLFLVKPRLA